MPWEPWKVKIIVFMTLSSHLVGRPVQCVVEDELFFAGSVGPQNVVWVLLGVQQHHHLQKCKQKVITTFIYCSIIRCFALHITQL